MCRLTSGYINIIFFLQLKIQLMLFDAYCSRPPEMPKLFINRRSAMEHRCDPSQDPEFKNSIFMQIYESLKPRDRQAKSLNYR